MRDLILPCIICDQPLHESGGALLQCSYCGKSEKSDYVCPQGHYVCESCRTATPHELIIRTCTATQINNVIELAELLMRHPAIPMTGPEHHLLVPAVLTTVAWNAGYAVKSRPRLKQALRRASRYPLGSCASLGACGAAMGVGIAVSILTGAVFTKPRERKGALNASVRSLAAMMPLPAQRCCKAAVYSSLQAGVTYLQEYLGVNLPEYENLECKFYRNNDECVYEECPFYPKKEAESGEV